MNSIWQKSNSDCVLIVILAVVTFCHQETMSMIPSRIRSELMNRRRFTRHHLRCPVTMVTSQGTMSGQSRNLSGDGALICCRQPLSPREGINLTVKFSDGFSLKVQSEVVWSYETNGEDEKNLYNVGVRFLGRKQGGEHSYQRINRQALA
jgi:hypothetical protein